MQNTRQAEFADLKAHPPGLAKLFFAFAQMSLLGFGGVLLWARRDIVERRRWLSPEAFNEIFALSQFLPGPNIVNLAMVFGSRVRGVPGGIVSFLGLLIFPAIIVVMIAAVYSQYRDIEPAQRALSGVVTVASGLLLGMTIKMIEPLAKRRSPLPFVIIAAVFLALGIMRWPLTWVVLTAVPASIAVTVVARRSRPS